MQVERKLINNNKICMYLKVGSAWLELFRNSSVHKLFNLISVVQCFAHC